MCNFRLQGRTACALDAIQSRCTPSATSLNVMKQHGFSYAEVLVSMLLLLSALLLIGETNMTALNLIGRGKINQRATLLLFHKIEELRMAPLENLAAGEFEEPEGAFTINWRIHRSRI